MTSQFDYTIVGGGPCGLSIAWLLSKYNKKVLLLDREASLGGCHRVRRLNGLFTEHGPRMYVNNYNTARMIYNDIGINFDDLFKLSKFQVSVVGNRSITDLHFKDLFWLTIHFIIFLFYQEPSKRQSMQDFANYYKFSFSSRDYINRLCRLTDGAGIERYTLFEFFNLINQNVFYSLMEPKYPNDKGLIKVLENHLIKSGVKILKNAQVMQLKSLRNNKIDEITLQDGSTLKTNNLILAIPPGSLVELLRNCTQMRVQNSFGNITSLANWAKKTQYLSYIPVVFHWNHQINFKRIWGFPANDWGIVYVVMSDYTKFHNPTSQTVISACITIRNKSKLIGKTPDECSKNELIAEVFRQIQNVFGNLPKPTKSILSPGVYKNDGVWKTKDTSYVRTKYSRKVPFKSSRFNNLYTVGTHNETHKYNFTSFESAVSNGIALCHTLIPESKNKYFIKAPLMTIKNLLIFIVVVLFMLLYKRV